MDDDKNEPRDNPFLSKFFDDQIKIIKAQVEQSSNGSAMLKKDFDTVRNRVTNLLERTEPRIALIEETLIGVGLLERNDNGEIVKTAPVQPKPKKRAKKKVVRVKTKVKAVRMPKKARKK